MPESIVANLVEAFWEHMLKEAPYEFEGRERHCSAIASGSIAIRKGDMTSLNVDDAVVGDGDAMDVSAEIIEQRLMPLLGMFAVDVPVFSPDFVGEEEVWELLSKHVSEHASEDGRESVDGKEEGLASFYPMCVV